MLTRDLFAVVNLLAAFSVIWSIGIIRNKNSLDLSKLYFKKLLVASVF